MPGHARTGGPSLSEWLGSMWSHSPSSNKGDSKRGGGSTHLQPEHLRYHSNMTTEHGFTSYFPLDTGPGVRLLDHMVVPAFEDPSHSFSIMTWPTDILINDVIRVPFSLYPHQHLLPPAENGQWRDKERLMQLDPFVMAIGKTRSLPDLSDLEKICSWNSTSSVNATF